MPVGVNQATFLFISATTIWKCMEICQWPLLILTHTGISFFNILDWSWMYTSTLLFAMYFRYWILSYRWTDYSSSNPKTTNPQQLRWTVWLSWSHFGWLHCKYLLPVYKFANYSRQMGRTFNGLQSYSALQTRQNFLTARKRARARSARLFGMVSLRETHTT